MASFFAKKVNIYPLFVNRQTYRPNFVSQTRFLLEIRAKYGIMKLNKFQISGGCHAEATAQNQALPQAP
jgi:hypothetical protein